MTKRRILLYMAHREWWCWWTLKLTAFKSVTCHTTVQDLLHNASSSWYPVFRSHLNEGFFHTIVEDMCTGMFDDKAGQRMILRKKNWILGFIGQVCIPNLPPQHQTSSLSLKRLSCLVRVLMSAIPSCACRTQKSSAIWRSS